MFKAAWCGVSRKGELGADFSSTYCVAKTNIPLTRGPIFKATLVFIEGSGSTPPYCEVFITLRYPWTTGTLHYATLDSLVTCRWCP